MKIQNIRLTNDSFTNIGVQEGAVLTFDIDQQPEPGDLTLFHDSKSNACQIVQYIEKGLIGETIVIVEYGSYPKIKQFIENEERGCYLAGKLISSMKVGEAV